MKESKFKLFILITSWIILVLFILSNLFIPYDYVAFGISQNYIFILGSLSIVLYKLIDKELEKSKKLEETFKNVETRVIRGRNLRLQEKLEKQKEKIRKQKSKEDKKK